MRQVQTVGGTLRLTVPIRARPYTVYDFAAIGGQGFCENSLVSKKRENCLRSCGHVASFKDDLEIEIQ